MQKGDIIVGKKYYDVNHGEDVEVIDIREKFVKVVGLETGKKREIGIDSLSP